MISATDFAKIETALLEFISEETGESMEELRLAVERYPDDAPWDSRAFVNLQFKIEEQFGVKFTDVLAVERASRSLDTMVEYILYLMRHKAAASA